MEHMTERMLARMETKTDVTLKEIIETRACQEATEACLESKEPVSMEVESVAEHEEVPKEEVAVEALEH
jgi:hypothetical protein